MSYVQRVLQPGEQVRKISSIHWIGYWPGVAVALLAVVAYWLSETRLLPGIWRYTAYALALLHHRQPNRASKQHHRNDAQSLELRRREVVTASGQTRKIRARPLHVGFTPPSGRVLR
jgi:hypothetical protein